MKIDMKRIYILLFGISLLITSCQSAISEDTSKTNAKQANKSEQKVFTAVIEIPAGTNKKIEQNKESLQFEIDKRDGKERIIQFLSYPANYGFIQGTLSDKEKGGDGDAVDILVIGESMSTGTVIEVIPIATLQLIDDGEEDYKVLAVPADASLNILQATTSDKIRNFEGIKTIIQTWFTSYDTDPAKIKGWLNQDETQTYILQNKLK